MNLRKLEHTKPGRLMSVKVNGNINYAINQLRKQIKDAGVFAELHERKQFIPKSVSKRKMIENAKFRMKNG